MKSFHNRKLPESYTKVGHRLYYSLYNNGNQFEHSRYCFRRLVTLPMESDMNYTSLIDQRFFKKFNFLDFHQHFLKYVIKLCV